jgi:hypothetical protein
MVTNAAQQLAYLLQHTGEASIERGMTALLESIAGCSPISADITVGPADQLTDEERVLLGTPLLADVHRREGLLRCAADLPIASVTALVVTSRVPEPARPALSITSNGYVQHTPQDGQARTPPLGRALYGLGITREQLSAAATPGHLDEAGSEIAVRSTARLWIPSGWPLALVTERVHAQFLAAHPPPWPLADTMPSTT